jgi:IS5 family transposase
LPNALGEAERFLADTGYFSAANVAAREAARIEPLIAMARQPRHPPVGELFLRRSIGAGKPDARGSDGAPVEDACRP